MDHRTPDPLRRDLSALGERLVAEYAGHLEAADVLRCVALCLDHLLISGVRDDLLAAVENGVRARLSTPPDRHTRPGSGWQSPAPRLPVPAASPQ